MKIKKGMHILAKPMGSTCNLDCHYCFYIEKENLFPKDHYLKMDDSILETYIRKYISQQPTPYVEFVWHGGEPTLAGLDFFKKAVKIQNYYNKGKTIKNNLQTNGTLLTDDFCKFLKEEQFIVGLSLDGPKEIHDRYRKDKNESGSFEKTMEGLSKLLKYDVEYNILACVAKETALKPLKVYNFFKKEGIKFIQFSPIVELVPSENDIRDGLRLSRPFNIENKENNELMPWSVEAKAYGNFLIKIYEEWVRNDVSKIFVMNFEWALNNYLGNESPICTHSDKCENCIAIEHDGSVFACDHYVYPEYKLGNITTEDFTQILEKRLLGNIKKELMPVKCKKCPVVLLCNGGCPKHRFIKETNSDLRVNYLCEGYYNFFIHIKKYLQAFMQILVNGYAPSLIMEAMKGPLVLEIKH